MLRKRLSVIVALVGCAFVLGASALFLFRHNAPVSFLYCVEATFDGLPKNDDPLLEWLKVQRGVVPDTVHIRRIETERDKLEVGFIQVRTIAGEPPLPNLEMKCAELGYKGPNGHFRDCKNRNW